MAETFHRRISVGPVKPPVVKMADNTLRKYSSNSAKLVYGVDDAGRIRHVSEVDRGFACGCVCPACAAPLNARKGDEKVHHFGHRGSFSCANAPETALHRLAKEIVTKERRLFVPEVKAEYRGVTKTIHRRKIVCFDKAVEEAKHLKDLVPDVHVERGGHQLLIEIYVTHACDELKRSGLRDNGIAAVEIDLSRFPRDASRSEVLDAVIEHAERTWLFHPKIDAALDAMRTAHRAKEDARQKKFEDEVETLLRRYDDALIDLASRKVIQPDTTREFYKIGLGAHIGSSVGGAGGFTVTEREWQYRVLRAFIPQQGERCSYRHHAIFEWIKEKGVLRSGFHYIRPELEEAMRERNTQFLSPYRAIEAYLNELVGRGVLKKFKSYAMSDTILSQLTEFRESVESKRKRRLNLVERVETILAMLPEQELDEFSLNDWIALAQNDGISFADAIEAEDGSFDAMLALVRKIEAMIFRKGPAVTHMLGLPILAEQARQMTARKQESDDREAAKRVEMVAKELALQKAADDRGEAFRSHARRSGAECLLWIDVAHPELLGMTPLFAAVSSEDGAVQARRLLQRFIDDRTKEQAMQAEIQHWKSELEREVFKVLKERTQPFLGSPYRLGGSGRKVKPRDYCVSKTTFLECLDLVKIVFKRMR